MMQNHMYISFRKLCTEQIVKPFLSCKLCLHINGSQIWGSLLYVVNFFNCETICKLFLNLLYTDVHVFSNEHNL